MKWIGIIALGLVLLVPLGCSDLDLTPASWGNNWRANPFKGDRWKKQPGAWSFSSKGREIESDFGFE